LSCTFISLISMSSATATKGRGDGSKDLGPKAEDYSLRFAIH